MKPNRIILTAAEDRELGGLGLLIEGMRGGAEVNPGTDGVTIAHDLLEHVNGPEHIGTIDDELEALGAIWYVRGQFDDLSRDGRGSHYTTHENIAADVVRMFRDFFYGASVDTKPPRTMPCIADDDLREILRYAAEDYRAEVHDEDAHETAKRFAEYERVCLPRMRIGYRKAAKRFRSLGGAHAANELFWLVARAVRPYAANVEYPGQQFDLIYGRGSTGMLFARCAEFFPEDEY
jgi:hypothetical protein